MRTCVVTIAATSSLHFVRALLRSVAEHHPEADRACVVVARDTREADLLRDEFMIVPVTVLGLPDGEDLLFQHDMPELHAALQPWIFEHFFSLGYEAVVLLAPQSRIERPLRDAFSLLETSADVVLIPASTATDVAPPASGAAAAELPRLSGCSPDFVAVRRTDIIRGFLRRWQERICRNVEPPRGEAPAGDPRSNDLPPARCDRTTTLRHPGYDVGPGNVADRRVHVGADGRPMAGDEPLVSWNFSGLDPDAPERLALPSGMAAASDLFRRVAGEHARELRDLGAAWYAGQPYDFGFFADGGRVTAAERSRFRRDAALRRACAGLPFAHPELARLVPDDAATDRPLAPSLAAIGEIWRLENVSEQLLGRSPTPAEIRTWRPRLRSLPGTVRLLLSVGLSREARSTPGSLARLLRYIADAPTAAGAVREYAVMPLVRLLSLVSRVFPSPADRPSAGDAGAIASEILPRQEQGHAAGTSPADPASRDTAGVNILGYFSRELGIGEAARSLARSCEAAGVRVNQIDVNALFETPVTEAAAAAFPRRRQLPIDILCYNADMTPAAARHLRALGHHAGYRIGFWHWEQPVLPRRFHEAFAEVDEVWVPSRFVHDAIAPVSPVPVVTMPHAVDFTPTPGVHRADFGLPDDKHLVLVMYDFHSFQERKNPRAAVAAFRAAKAAEPSLGLVVKTINAGQHPRERLELEETLRDVPDVTFIDAALTRQQAWDLEACCDILLSLHRAEGFGLILAEMMLLGKPVVATGWSANMDFMDESNAVPVSFTLAPLPRPVGPYEAGIPWAEPDIDHAAAALRRLATDRDLAVRLGRAASESIRRTLAPEVVGRRVRERLDVIRRCFPRAGAVPPPIGGAAAGRSVSR